MANNIILPFSEIHAELNDEAMIDPNAIIEITENGLYNVAKYGYANVNVEGGGGGSSDFSTAEVTFICTGEPDITLPFINIQDDGVYSEINITQSTQTVTVPLYKNKLSCTILPLSMSVTSTSGNITGSQMDGYIISGNCTINYTLPM